MAKLKEVNANKQGVDVDQLIENVQDKKDEKKLLEERLKAEQIEDERTAKEWLEMAQNSRLIEASSSTNFFTKTDTSNKRTSSKREGLVVIKKKKSLVDY